MRFMGFPLCNPVLVQTGAEGRRLGCCVHEAQGQRVNRCLTSLWQNGPQSWVQRKHKALRTDGEESHLLLGPHLDNSPHNKKTIQTSILLYVGANSEVAERDLRERPRAAGQETERQFPGSRKEGRLPTKASPE